MDNIHVPDAMAKRIDEYLRQQKELQLAIQVTIDTAAEVLGVPTGAKYDPAERAFVMQAPPPETASQGQP